MEDNQTMDSYDFTINPCEDGLRITTHENMRITLNGTILAIFDLGKMNNDVREAKTPHMKDFLIPCQYDNIRAIIFQCTGNVRLGLPTGLLARLALRKASLCINEPTYINSDKSIAKIATMKVKLSVCVKNYDDSTVTPLDLVTKCETTRKAHSFDAK